MVRWGIGWDHTMSPKSRPESDHDCFVMMCHDRLERAEAMVKQLTRERDDALSRWHQMADMQKALVELADKLYPPHYDPQCGDGTNLIAAVAHIEARDA